MEAEKTKHQHPAGIFIAALRDLLSIAFYLLVYYLLSGAKTDSELLAYSYLTFVAIILSISVSIGFVRWFFFTYRVNPDGSILVLSGIIIKRRRNLNRQKVQLVDIEAGVLQQLFKVVSLKIETAGGQGSAEVVFTALSRKKAEALKAKLSKEQAAESPEETSSASNNSDIIVASLGLKDLFLFGISSGSFGYLFAIFYFAFELAPEEQTGKFLQYLGSTFASTSSGTVFAALLALLIVSWLCSALIQMVRHAGFKVRHAGEEILVEYGLLKRRTYHIPVSRIRSVILKESILRQIFGLVSVSVEINRGRGKGAQEVMLLLPAVRKGELNKKLKQTLPLLPDFSTDFTRPPRRSIHRYMIKKLLIGLILLLILLYSLSGYWPVPLFSSFSFCWILLFMIFGFMAWKYSGIAFAEQALTIRSGSLNLNTTIILPQRILGVECWSHPLQRRAQVCHLSVILPTGSGARRFAHGDLNTAIQAFEWYRDFRKSRAAVVH